jgi:hypothetical protein
MISNNPISLLDSLRTPDYSACDASYDGESSDRTPPGTPREYQPDKEEQKSSMIVIDNMGLYRTDMKVLEAIKHRIRIKTLSES